MTPATSGRPMLRQSTGRAITGGGGDDRPLAPAVGVAATERAAILEIVKAMRAARQGPCYRAALYDVILALENRAKDQRQTLGGNHGKEKDGGEAT